MALVIWAIMYSADRYCSNGDRNPKNVNRYNDLRNLTKKELISLINKEREDIKSIVNFFDNLDVHDLSDRKKALDLVVIKALIKYFTGKSGIF